jgi:hypothetical protein
MKPRHTYDSTTSTPSQPSRRIACTLIVLVPASLRIHLAQKGRKT